MHLNNCRFSRCGALAVGSLAIVFASGTASAVVITQSASQTVVPGSVSCNAGGLHTDNSYFRTFTLADHLLIAPFSITSVSFGVESASGAGGSQPVSVRIYSTNGTTPGPTAGLGVPLFDQSFSIADQTLSIVTVPVAALVNTSGFTVEIFTPSGQTAGNSFFIGSNAAGQTRPSFIAAAACGIPDPMDIAAIGFPNMQIVMSVEGVVVPAPGALALLGVGGLMATRRRRA